MNFRTILASVATAGALTASVGLSAPAQASPPKRHDACVRITAPGSHDVKAGDTVRVIIRTSKACAHARVSLDGCGATRIPNRVMVIDQSYGVSGTHRMEVRVKAKGHPAVVRVLTYRVEAAS